MKFLNNFTGSHYCLPRKLSNVRMKLPSCYMFTQADKYPRLWEKYVPYVICTYWRLSYRYSLVCGRRVRVEHAVPYGEQTTVKYSSRSERNRYPIVPWLDSLIIVKHCWCVMKQYFHTVKHSCSEFAYNEFRLTMKQVSFYLVLKHIKFDKYSNFLQQQIKMSSPGNVAISVLYCLSTHNMNHYGRIYE